MKIRLSLPILCSFVFLSSTGVVWAESTGGPVKEILVSPRPVETALERGFAVRDGRIQVVAIAKRDTASTVAGWLEFRGARHMLAIGERVQAFVPPELLAELSARPDVLAVERPFYAELPEPRRPAAESRPKVLAVTSEALDALNVAAWHAEGVTGAGIKVGVIDVEFGGWEGLLGVELPPADRTTYRAFGGSQAAPDQVHGTACAEIVHDIAPDAELYLAHISTGNDLFAALNWLETEGVGVATMSLGWYGTGPGDGTGTFDDRIVSFVNGADALFMTSAGNDRLSHWQGVTDDGDGNDWVDFEPGDDLNQLSLAMSAGDRVAVNISWDDWSSPTSDYSLHLFNVDGPEPVEVALSDRPQTGLAHQTPFETINYTAPDGGRFAVRINRAGVIGLNDMELFSLDSNLDTSVAAGSITVPSDSEIVVAVAAVNYNAPFNHRSFSSAGPANGPGGSLTGGGIKPDISGYDGVSTASYGTRGFYGTSAASPHAAGAAALVRASEPTFDQAQTRTFLEIQAPDLGPGGKDNDYGWGRVFLGAAPGSNCIYDIDPTAISLGANGGGGRITVTTDEGCPWTTSSRADWMNVAPASATGSGSAAFSAQANLDSTQRVGELVVAGNIVTVTQAGSGCSYVLSPTSQTFTATGGNGQFTIQTDAGCAWSATSGTPWIDVTDTAGSGTGTIRFVVDPNPTVDQRAGSITAGEQLFTVTQTGIGPESTIMVAGIAETEGTANTRWKSDLAIFNPAEDDAEVDLTYRHEFGTAHASLTVEPGGVVELVNVAGTTFSQPNSAGAVELSSSIELVVTARTYNDAPAGTFGQFLPGATEEDGLAAGQVAAISQLRSGSGFRTNIGFVDLGGSGAIARIRLFSSSGVAVGSELAEIIPAGGWVQRNRVFRAADAGECRGCYALVDLGGGGGPVWAYASVVDNASGDPTTVPMTLLDSGKTAQTGRYLVAGIAEVGGANQTRWKSNLALLNRSGQPLAVDLTYRHDGGSENAALTLADGEMREFEDVAGELFAAPGTAGAVDVDAGADVVVTARTFNDSPQGTFGQFLPGLSSGAALMTGADGILSQLKSTESFRTNIGFTNFSGVECTVRTYLHDADGVRQGVIFSSVPPGAWTQLNRVFINSGIGTTPLGYAVVRVITPGCEVWAYASVVDNDSGDPTTVPVVIR